MKRLFYLTISKKFLIVVVFITILILSCYSSYALFTINRQKNNSYYQLFYLNNNDIKIEYKKDYDIPYGIIEKDGGQRKVFLIITNESNASQSVILGVQGGLISKEFTLENDRLAVNQVYELPVMRLYSSSSVDDYHSNDYKSKVTSVVFKADTMIPSNVVDSFDVSDKKDNSVIAYIERVDNNYNVTIGGKGGVLANPYSNHLFYGFHSLKTIDFSCFNTSGVINMNGLFHSCYELVNIDLAMFDTSNVTNMASMFCHCRSLDYLNLSTFDTSHVTNMKSMFQDCSSLKNINLSSFNTLNVIDMSYMFRECTNLLGLNLDNFNTSNVTSMIEMFYVCRNLSEISIKNFTTSNVIDMNHMFSYCNSLVILDLSGFSVSNVKNMASMFSYTTSLKTIFVNNQWDVSSKNTDNMFTGSLIDHVTFI